MGPEGKMNIEMVKIGSVGVGSSSIWGSSPNQTLPVDGGKR